LVAEQQLAHEQQEELLFLRAKYVEATEQLDALQAAQAGAPSLANGEDGSADAVVNGGDQADWRHDRLAASQQLQEQLNLQQAQRIGRGVVHPAPRQLTRQDSQGSTGSAGSGGALSKKTAGAKLGSWLGLRSKGQTHS
jgi:hypothetical protein